MILNKNIKLLDKLNKGGISATNSKNLKET